MCSTGTERVAESQNGRASVVNPDPAFESLGVIGRQSHYSAPFGRSFAWEHHQFHLFLDTHKR